MRKFFGTLLGKKRPEFFDVIKGRKSVKYFDPNVKIKREEIIEMLNEANIAPSSCNLQPWRYIVVDTQEGKEKLGSANYNKIQNDTSAAMIIVLGDLDHYGKFDEIYGEAVEKGYMTEEVKDGFEKGMGSQLENLPTDKNREGVYFDCGLWTMQFANIAYAKGYDTNIIGGFVREKVAELFELEENLIPVMLIALGKKEKDARPTVRMKAENLVRFE
ncbi:MAG: nitroreductase family protein [Gemella haemolysans]|uniref:nitroreductase family protein n=1 Tax=Gemella haemolysans TaxID=1379 RepID=UPI00290E401C|nr:nitroreductase family protein [Gemella haemolysans]MDU6573169.1 nitroreductase family protein [Gemella haemolysans]